MGFFDKFKGQIAKSVGRFLDADARVRFQQAKDFILSEVESHAVSQELREKGPSQFLGSSTGTLFGFMGFEAGTDPVGDLVSYLDESITYQSSFSVLKLRLVGNISIPSKEEMRSVPDLKMPWLNGVSWPEAIEDGVSGLPFFLRFPDKKGRIPNTSRSGRGLQALHPVRSDDMEPVPFLSKIFSDAKRIA